MVFVWVLVECVNDLRDDFAASLPFATEFKIIVFHKRVEAVVPDLGRCFRPQ